MKHMIAGTCLALICSSAFAETRQTQSPDAVCSNGERALFHVFENGGSNWLVYLQGGGVAATPEEYLSRIPRWTRPQGEGGYFASVPVVADFVDHGYNAVVIPYCTSDLHQGAHSHMIEGQDVFFHGRLIVEDVLNQMRMELMNAETLIFAGSSAGAIGLGFNADLISEFPDPYLIVDSFWLDTESRRVRDSWSGENWDRIEAFVYGNMPDHCGGDWASCFPQRDHFDDHGLENIFLIWNLGDPYMRGDEGIRMQSIMADIEYYGTGLSIQDGERSYPDYRDWLHGMLANDHYDFPIAGGSLRDRIWIWLRDRP